MKLIKKLAFLFVCSLIVLACAHSHKRPGPHRIPPGQVKKITGEKSARPYAPGQVKKIKGKKHPKPHKIKRR